MSTPRITETYTGSLVGVLVGLVQWAVTTYAFPGMTEPPPVTIAVYTVVPALLGGVAAYFTRRECKLPEPPSAPAAGPAASK
jgi:hypothetical protein